MSLYISKKVRSKILDSLGTDNMGEVIKVILYDDESKTQILDHIGKEFILNYLLGNENESIRNSRRNGA